MTFAIYAFFSTEETLNRMPAVFGLSGPTWLLPVPMFSVIMASIWRGTVFSMMVYNAALGDVLRTSPRLR